VTAPSRLAALPTGTFYENAPHRFGRSGEEMAAPIPTLGVFDVHQPQVRVVNKSRGL
jgi:hypothetical protein